jgi:hypothetical protein
MAAREHTAQVPSEDREEREILFREGKLPILYCSPTMELGIDIKDLNVVNLRNIRRRRRTMRSAAAPGAADNLRWSSHTARPQFCTTNISSNGPSGWWQRREHRRADLTNEDLVRAHIHSIWLAEKPSGLGKSLKDILDVAGDDPTLNLQEGVRADIEAEGPRHRARARAEKVIATFRADLLSSGWYHDGWLDDVLTQVARRRPDLDRWRGL